jgi:hypothetical protein
MLMMVRVLGIVRVQRGAKDGAETPLLLLLGSSKSSLVGFDLSVRHDDVLPADGLVDLERQRRH